jgi:hypothetical protein
VVPTAITPPAARAHGVEPLGRAPASIRPHSACIAWSAVSSALTGRKVPAPTCSVSVSRRPRLVERSIRRGVKCSAAVGAATAPSSRRTSSGNPRDRPRRWRACRRYRAAAASSLRVRAALRPARRRRRPGPAAIGMALSAMAVHAGGKAIRSPSRSRLALRTKACQRRRSIRLCSVAPIRASPRRPFELGRNDAGIVEHQHVAGAQQLRQVAHVAIGEGPPPRTTSIRAASRGRAGRRAMRSGGSSKSNRSTRMAGN